MIDDIQYICGELDELQPIVQYSFGVPMRMEWAVVVWFDLFVMLEELSGWLPAELAEAEWIRRECGAIVAAAEEEAERIIQNAHHRADESVPDTELYRRVQRRAGEVIEQAERYAEEVVSGSEVYRDRVMGQDREST